MTTVRLTAHAGQRLRQRGMRESDLAFILSNGTDVGRGVIITEHDAANIERGARKLIETAHRLKGKLLVVDRDVVITTFHADRRQHRRLCRAA